MKRTVSIAAIVLFCLCGNLFSLDEDFCSKINNLKWIAYSPTNFNPIKGVCPLPVSIKDDLALLHRVGFNGIITYGSQEILMDIPKIARESGFEGVIMGIWNFKDEQEVDNAVKMAEYVDGYCVGNEGLSLRYEVDELIKAIENVKAKTNKPVTTTEEINDYAKRYMVELGDWIFPNAHPYFSNAKSPYEAARWVKKHYQIIKRGAPENKPILFKEVGLPTRGDSGCSQRRQKEFFILMEQSEVNFAYFEAFDQYWKRHHSVEPYWGLFDKKRQPKKFAYGKLNKDKKYAQSHIRNRN